MKSRKRDQIIILTLVSAALLIFVSLWLRSKFAPEPPADILPISVSTVKPILSDLQEDFSFTSILEADNTIAVVPKVAGTIMDILVEEGDLVEKGDLLAKIDPEPYLLELGAAESAWVLAESSLSRTEHMFENSGSSRQQLDEARAGRDMAYATYELAKMKVGYSDIRSPIQGQVIKRLSDVGNPASFEQSLFLITDVENPKVKVRVPEKYWSRFSDPEGILALVSFPDSGDSLDREAAVDQVSPSISPEGKTFEVTFSVPSGEKTWPVGATINVEIILSQHKNTWSLPLRAMSGDGAVWLIDPDNLVVSRFVVSDPYDDGERFVVPEDWADKIFVLDGHHRLSEGQKVQPFESGV